MVSTIKAMLDSIPQKKIMDIESGCYGTFPMLLAAFDERVDFRLFTTVPFLIMFIKEKCIPIHMRKTVCLKLCTLKISSSF